MIKISCNFLLVWLLKVNTIWTPQKETVAHGWTSITKPTIIHAHLHNPDMFRQQAACVFPLYKIDMYQNHTLGNMILLELRREYHGAIRKLFWCLQKLPTWAALAQTVTGSNLETADAIAANTRWPWTALFRQLSGRSYISITKLSANRHPNYSLVLFKQLLPEYRVARKVEQKRKGRERNKFGRYYYWTETNTHCILRDYYWTGMNTHCILRDYNESCQDVDHTDGIIKCQ